VPLIFDLVPGGLFLFFAGLAGVKGKWAFVMLITEIDLGCLVGLLANVEPATPLLIFTLILAVLIYGAS